MDIDLSKLSQHTNGSAPLNIKKYVNYILKKKIWVLLSAIIFSSIGGTVVPIYLDKKKTYTTSSVIRFDNPRLNRGISAVTDFTAGMDTESKASLFTSNSFIESVVDSLDLNLIIITSKVRRTRLFREIHVRSDAVFGKYTIQVRVPTFIFEFEDPITKETSVIKTLNDMMGTGIVFNTNGLYLNIDTNELSGFEKIEFAVTSIPMASNYIRDRLYYNIDRTRTIMTIFFEHSDPEFSPYVTNKVTDMFVNKLLEYKRFQTRSILETLDEQLKVAQVELSESEAELRTFRESNPKVFLTQGRETLINNLAIDQTQIENIQALQTSIDQMKQKLQTSPNQDARQFVYIEIISFLENQNIAGASLLSERYQTLIAEKDRLKNENYTDDHPLTQNNYTQIIQTQNEISGRLDEYQHQLLSNLNSAKQNIYSGQRTLRSLPRNEMKLAELERNRQIKENILSSIMVRYNEAKVTDAAVIPDAYIVDRAIVPIIIPGGIIEKIKFAGVGFFMGLLLATFGFAGLAFLDKKIWVAQEVQDKIKIPILALIPVIGRDNPNEEFKNNETIDPKLITSDYAPTLAGETFRKLRTVLDMQMDNNNKALITGSLFPSEGKSLISANLAIAFAQQKKKTILIDGDLRRGVQHSTLAKNKIPGLTDLIIKKGNVDAKLVTNYVQDTHIPNLFLMTCGNPVPNPSELLGSPKMEQIFQIIQSKFERIIFDSPPFGLSPDLMVMTKFSTNILLVLRSGNTNLSEFKKNLDEFGKLRQNITGLVINSSDEVMKGRDHQYSYYQY